MVGGENLTSALGTSTVAGARAATLAGAAVGDGSGWSGADCAGPFVDMIRVDVPCAAIWSERRSVAGPSNKPQGLMVASATRLSKLKVQNKAC